LVAALEHDAKMASRPQMAMPSEADAPGWARVGLWALLVLGGGGAVICGVLGFASGSSSCSSQDIVCFSRGDLAFVGAVVFGLAGAGIFLVGSLVWLLVRMARRHRSRAAS
jgi:hypothetical protein